VDRDVCDLIATGGPASLDFPQAFGRRGAIWVANTGYGYGDSAAPALSEELMSSFAHHLGVDTSVAVGDALVRARLDYALNNMGFYGPYDEKVLIEATLYGPPMYRVTVPSPGAGEPEREETGASVNGEGLTPDPLRLQTPAQDGLIVRSVAITPALTVIHTPQGTYYAGDAGVQAMLYRPLQPRASLDIALPGGAGTGAVTHGVLFLAGRYTDIADSDPVITMPVTETARYEPQWIYTGWQPQALARINHFQTPQGVQERLVLILGQFHHTDVRANRVRGIERLYNSVAYDVYCSASPDVTPPTLKLVNVTQESDALRFVARASDASGIVRAVAVYTAGAGSWDALELTHDATGDVWVGELTGVAGEITFMVQAVDGAGNVGVSRAKGHYFTPVAVDAGGGRRVAEGAGIAFSGSGPADVAIAWDFGDGLGATGHYTPTHRYRDDGRFVVALRVSDVTGRIGMDTVVVTVDNVAPTTVLGETSLPPAGFVRPGQTVTFTAAFTDPGVLDTHTARIDWRDGVVEGGGLSQGAAFGAVTGSHRYSAEGTFNVEVCVADDDGGVGCDSFVVIVRELERSRLFLPLLLR
jgi:hypothetical protein